MEKVKKIIFHPMTKTLYLAVIYSLCPEHIEFWIRARKVKSPQGSLSTFVSLASLIQASAVLNHPN